MFGNKAETIKLLERELREAKVDAQKAISEKNKFQELVNKTHVFNFFHKDRYLPGQPEWIKREDAVKFHRVCPGTYEEVWFLGGTKVETLYTTKEAARFYKSAIVEWNKKAAEVDRKQKKADAEANKKIKESIKNMASNQPLGSLKVQTSPLVPMGKIMIINPKNIQMFGRATS